ncbi:MAG: hypothetical protein ACRD8U_15280, partial [Pyrinomonadaceae bacterium]
MNSQTALVKVNKGNDAQRATAVRQFHQSRWHLTSRLSERIRMMRTPALLSIALLLIVACQWNPLDKSANTSSVSSEVRETGADSSNTVSDADATTTTRSASFTEAEFARHIAQLKTKLPSPRFSIVVQPPFVVVGDEPRHVVEQRSENTVKWAVDRLKQDFFTKDPSEILDIWLFKDDHSYRKHTRLLFGDEPT